MTAYALSALLGAFLMLGVPALAVWGWQIVRPWNTRRLARARRYRAAHGTPWWVLETDAAQRRRWWVEAEADRADGGTSLGARWRP